MCAVLTRTHRHAIMRARHASLLHPPLRHRPSRSCKAGGMVISQTQPPSVAWSRQSKTSRRTFPCRWTQLTLSCATDSASIGLHALGLTVSCVEVDGAAADFSLRSPPPEQLSGGGAWHNCILPSANAAVSARRRQGFVLLTIDLPNVPVDLPNVHRSAHCRRQKSSWSS